MERDRQGQTCTVLFQTSATRQVSPAAKGRTRQWEKQKLSPSARRCKCPLFWLTAVWSREKREPL